MGSQFGEYKAQVNSAQTWKNRKDLLSTEAKGTSVSSRASLDKSSMGILFRKSTNTDTGVSPFLSMLNEKVHS